MRLGKRRSKDSTVDVPGHTRASIPVSVSKTRFLFLKCCVGQ